MLEEILAARILKVYLTGGEPMVLPDFWELLEGLLAAGTFVELTTNATRIDAEAAARLQELGLQSLQVSLNGSSPEVNDPIMGDGSFAAIRKGILAARAAGLPLHARPTVSSSNLADIPSLLDALGELGVDRVDLREVTPLGRAAEGPFPGPSKDELAELDALCDERSRQGQEVRLRSWTLEFSAQGHPALCSLGQPRPRVVIVDEAGNLYPCSAAAYLGFDNSVLEFGLLGAWERLEVLHGLRDASRLTGECRSCELLEPCAGGCRAAAARLGGDPWGPDPTCPRVDSAEPQEKALTRAPWKGIV